MCQVVWTRKAEVKGRARGRGIQVCMGWMNHLWTQGEGVGPEESYVIFGNPLIPGIVYSTRSSNNTHELHKSPRP